MSISAVFYAIFHDANGPQIVYQVPEDLITIPSRRPLESQPTPNSSSSAIHTSGPSVSNLPTPAIEIDPGSVPDLRELDSKHSISSKRSANSSRNKLNASASSKLNFSLSKAASHSPNRESSKTLFEWDLVSQFVIPRPDLCGRLTISTTKKHRIVGFPVIVRNGEDARRYSRGTFEFNLCFVFEKDVDVRSFESVVRKLARVLTACEIDHQFLSSPTTRDRIYPILEQLFTDLNSFSETSIRIDRFNSIELRIFPVYPNPPPVNTWDVPVPLIDIGNKDKMEGNWDLTMRKVVPFINGVDHVKKIAIKADADVPLVKECMRQVMMYQCVMMIDIFQFSNLYTLCRPVMWLFTDPAVYEECGPYVHKGEGEPLAWPKLAWYYARLKPPLTVGRWITQYGIDLERIDIRRFISFGVIKGFLRRVHRWPILLKDDKFPHPAPSIPQKRRNKSINWPTNFDQNKSLGNPLELGSSLRSEPPPILGNSANVGDGYQERPAYVPVFGEAPPLLREDTIRPGMPLAPGGLSRTAAGAGVGRGIGDGNGVKAKHPPGQGVSASIPDSYVATSVLKARLGGASASSVDSTQVQEEEDARALSLPVQQELAEQAYAQGHVVAKLKGVDGMAAKVEVPPELTDLLDGTHHSDELCVHFGLSWNVMHAMLSVIGGGTGDDEDLGRVVILLR